MSDLNDRMNFVMSQKGFSLRDVSNGTKINYEMIRRYSQGIAKPRDEKLELISDFLGVTKSWLLFGHLTNSEHDNNHDTDAIKDNGSYNIEVLDVTASAGDGYINSDIKEVIKLIEYDSEEARILFKGIPSRKIKVINLKGDSMQGTFECGDAIYVDVSVQEFDSDGIYVFSFGRGIYIKRLQLIKDVLRVKSDNKLYDPWDIHENEIDQLYIHGKVLFSQSMLLRKHG